MTTKEAKDKVRDSIEHGFDKLHKVADTVTSYIPPVAIADGAVHGVARGVHNWLTDQHPQVQCKPKPAPSGNDCGEKPKPAPGGSDCGEKPKPAINIQGNEIKDNSGGNIGNFSNFGNR